MYSKYQIIKILENWFQKMNCFSWIKLIPVLIHLKYRYNNSPYLELPCLSHHPQHPLHHVLLYFPYFVISCPTTHHHKYWKNQTICQGKPFRFIFKLYADQNTFQTPDQTCNPSKIWVPLQYPRKIRSIFTSLFHPCSNNHRYNPH